MEENYNAATCRDEGGYDEVIYCAVCEAELSRTHHVIDKLTTHTPADAMEENYNAATCKDEGGCDEVVYCSVCEAELSRSHVTLKKTAHTPSATVTENRVEPFCTTEGSYDEAVYCSVCGAQISRKTIRIPATGHTDKDGDDVCDVCGDTLAQTPQQEKCTHICHTTNPILKFFWRIINFFSKLFGAGEYCVCGERHW